MSVEKGYVCFKNNQFTISLKEVHNASLETKRIVI